MEKIYNFVKKETKKQPAEYEYFFIELVTGNKHIINNGHNTDKVHLCTSTNLRRAMKHACK